MNILYLTNHLDIGGITSYSLTLASGMKKKGHNVYMASSTGKFLSVFLKYGINYIKIPIRTKQEVGPKIFLSFLKLLRELRSKRIDIIHSNSRTTQVLGCLVSKFAGIAHISTCHGFFKKKLSRKIFPCLGKSVIAISEQVKEHLINDFKVKEDRITVINNGIDIDKFKELNEETKTEAKKSLGLSESPVIGIVARLSDVKGHTFLIQAFAEVLKFEPQAQLLIVGEGKMKEELIQLAKDSGVSPKIVFLPEVDDTRRVLAAMDIFVMPSLKEGLGLALMEAMSSRLAVIGSDIGGIKSLIKNEVNGILVKPADVNELKRAILELLKDEKKRECLASKAEDFIRNNFSQEKMIEETERVYKKCLN